MNSRVDQDWTPSEVEEARSIIVRLNNNGCYRDSYGHDKNNNKKHDIVDELHAWFPWKTMQQVTDLYVDLAMQIHMMQWQEEENCGANKTKGTNGTADGFVNKNFGVQEEHKATMDGKDFVLGFPSEEKRVMEIEEEAPVVGKNNVEVLENKMAGRQPAVAQYARRFWTKEEHRLFLHGLRAYGRGQWKSISKYFVTTRTPAQVSSHAQKYFKRLESKGSGRRRYSINDVGLHDDDWMVENNFNGWKAPTFIGAGTGDHYPNLRLLAPTNSSIIIKNNAQFWSPFPKQVSQRPAWSEQQMVVSAAAQMEGAGGKQGSA